MDSGKSPDIAKHLMLGSQNMSRRNFLIAGSSALTAAGLLAACGGGGSSTGGATTGGGGGGGSDITFGFSQPYAEVPIVATIKKIVQRDAEGEGWTVLLDETKAGNIQEQTGTIDTWITQQIDALCMFPADKTAFETTARRAVEAGIIWTTYAEEMEEGAGGVLFPPELSGRITGKATVDWINKNDPEAEVGILEIENLPEQQKRTTIPAQMIEEETKAKIVAVQPAIEQAKGLQVTEDILQAHPGVTVMVCHNDDGALGAAEAFRKVGKVEPSKVFIIGQDGSEDALEELKNPQSYYKASAALDIAELCEECVNLPKRAIEKEWKKGDEQEYAKLAPTLIEQGDTQLINQFLKTYQSA
jgi:ABC-type sugar transport system substrate-binding protein